MYRENFPPRVRKARQDAGYTQAQVAEITGIPRSNISKYETGNQEPNLEQLGILAQFYNTSINWLLGVTLEKEWPAGDNPPAGLVYISCNFRTTGSRTGSRSGPCIYIMQFLLNHRLAKYKISLSLFPLAKLLLFLISTRYVPPFAEIRRFLQKKDLSSLPF